MKNFQDVQFMSAKDKELVLKNWKRFIKSLAEDRSKTFKDKHGNGETLPFKYFTKRLYQHLIQHCSFIAHYDRHGFFQTYFVEPEDIPRFFKSFDKDQDYQSCECGVSYHMSGDYADINMAMAEKFEKVKGKLFTLVASEAKERDLQQAKALLAKHGIEQA